MKATKKKVARNLRRQKSRPRVEVLETRQLLSNTFAVTNTLDNGSAGSLPWAIGQVNADSSDNAASPDGITFAIPTSDPGYSAGIWTIAPTTALPAITQPVIINGYTQTGASANTLAQGDNAVLKIDLDGTNAGSTADGLAISAGSSTVTGLAITHFFFGLYLELRGSDSITGNFLGIIPSGTAEGNREYGILVDSVSQNTIGGTVSALRNVVSGNASRGIGVEGNSASDNLIEGNFIGIATDGKSALGNGNEGIAFDAGFGNTVGGTISGARNVISANGFATPGVSQDAVSISYGSTTNNVLVEGNFLGTDVTGTIALGNAGSGVYLKFTMGNTIGGTIAAARNIISGNNYNGVAIEYSSSGNLVVGNYIGTDITGEVAIANSPEGVLIDLGSTNNTIGGPSGGGNVISGNTGDGISLDDDVSGAPPIDANVFQGNIIGLNALGTAALGNGSDGIDDVGYSNTIGGSGPSDGNIISANGRNGLSMGDPDLVQGNFIGTDITGTRAIGNVGDGIYGGSGTIGGPVSSDKNVISGNGGNGIYGGGFNAVQGNYIGTDVTGMVALGNAGDGISLVAGGSVGGTAAGAGNVISGNVGNGISIYPTDTYVNGAVVEGNVIGANASGMAALGNGLSGVLLTCSVNTIGGTAPGSGNLISGNHENGIAIEPSAYAPSQNLIEGNYIGTNSSGDAPIGNEQDGIFDYHGASAGFGPFAPNTIGGDTSSANVIAYNDGTGVDLLDASPSVTILSNSIHDNAMLGIDLGGDGVTPNTPGGPHAGPNDLQNYPVLDFAGSSPGAGIINGTLNSTPGSTFTIQFFSNETADPSGYGQGQTYLGELTGITTDASGNASFSFYGPGSFAGQFISATATDPNGNTSEFSQDIQAVPLPDVAVSVAQSTANTTFGGNVAYTFTVANNGSAPATNLVVTDTLPPSLTNAVASANLGDFQLVGRVFTDTVSSLPVGTSFQVQFTANAASVGTISNTLVAISSTSDADPTNNSATTNTQVAQAPTTTTLSSTPNPSSYAQSVTFTANVNAPDGTVFFFADGSPFASMALVNGSASVSISSLTAGSHTISASYSGDANYAPSQSAALTQTVTPAANTTTLLVTPSPATFGQVVTFQATVSDPGVPTGFVTFLVDGSAVDSAPLVAGTATFSTSSLTGGSHTITASYSGDANFAPSSASVMQVVNPASSFVTLAASPNPAAVDSPVTLTASVSGPATPSGTVSFFDGATLLGQAAVGLNGQAQLVLPVLTVGMHAISAEYSGNSDLLASTSAVVDQVVNAAPTVVTVERFGYHARPTTLVLGFSVPLDVTSSQNPANYQIVGPHKKVIPILSATLSADGTSVTLKPLGRLNVHKIYTLEVIGTPPGGVTSSQGVRLDGAGNGAPGSDFVTTITRSNLVVPKKPTAHAAAAHTKAVDAAIAALARREAKLSAEHRKIKG